MCNVVVFVDHKDGSRWPLLPGLGRSDRPGFTPVINPNHEALTRARLVHVDQYYLCAETIAAANAALIQAQAKVPIVQHWGQGLLASVDGLRFVVPVRTINAAPAPSTSRRRRASPG
ncbi:hypothetical protein GCM10011583_66990 [Streptomyces camponoticapitis]|uniref:Tn3 transposase DDE domain-containing protein n=1 Tax=Streptomyces camponoticapitis TaxID=1616125 RepID=A0ABQ2EUM9_9ACTN|nr:hypothetical protein GCM10011583_66990 [Streptomyces camponoticapitis]